LTLIAIRSGKNLALPLADLFDQPDIYHTTLYLIFKLVVSLVARRFGSHEAHKQAASLLGIGGMMPVEAQALVIHHIQFIAVLTTGGKDKPKQQCGV
jgi:hypothetical protein